MKARFIIAPWNFAIKFGASCAKLEAKRKVACCVLLLLLACAPSRDEDAVIVFAASSLTDVFSSVAEIAARQMPPLMVRTNFAGSQQLAQQIVQGARADILATADERWIEFLRSRELITSVRPFASNHLVVVASGAMTLRDLAKPNVRIVVGADATPVGRYTREVLSRIEQKPELGPAFAAGVRRNIVSEEENVRGVLAKVLLGEADAGFVYRTDVMRLTDDKLGVIQIPDDLNVSARYFVAIVGVEKPQAASFMGLLLSDSGEAALRTHGFTPLRQ